MKIKLLYLIIFFTTNSFFLFSQTNVSGGLFKDTTWSVNGSPYIVTADVALFPGNTLTIEQGVTIKFNSGTKLILRGTLVSSATIGNEIIFTSNLSNPTKGSWTGIEVENNQGGKIIASNIKGEYADNFIKIMNSSSGEILNINNSEIKNCNRAFYGFIGKSTHTIVLDNLNINNNVDGYIYAQNVTLTNSVFSDGERGFWNAEQNSNIMISNCEFYNFSLWTIVMDQGVIDNCHIHDNEIGIRFNPNTIVKNSIIEFNTIGITSLNLANPVATGHNIFNNKICDNSGYNVKHDYSFPLTLGNNCYCLSDENDISQTIYDGYDDVSVGIVSFMPFNIGCSSSLSIEKFSKINGSFYFYPNPASNEITLSDNLNGNYEIYSTNGVFIKKGIITKKLNISELSSGLYLIKIFSLNQSEFSIKKLVKK